MGKKINEAAIANELEEASVFFKKTTSRPKKTSTSISGSSRQDDRTDERSNERLAEKELSHSDNRQIIRHSFDIYRDQLLKLQYIQLEAVQRGNKKPKLGDLVRKALDEFLD